MAIDFQAKVQAALYGALNGNVSASVFDHVPFEPEGAENANFPTVIVGETEMTPFDNDSHRGVYADASIHVWSRYMGRKEVRDLLDAIYGILHRANLSGTGVRFVDCLFVGSDVFTMEDGKTREGIARFRLTVQEV